MIIDKDHELSPYIVVIKNNEPLGLCQWVDTKTKRYCKVMYPSTSTEEGNYDQLVLNIDLFPNKEIRRMPNTIKNICADLGIKALTGKEMKKFREELGIVV